MEQIALGEDADHPAGSVHDRHAADPPLDHQCGGFRDFCVWPDRHHVPRHDVCRSHDPSPSDVAAAVAPWDHGAELWVSAALTVIKPAGRVLADR
jgi:hypothetical protein